MKWDPTPMPGWAEAVNAWPWEEWNVGGGRQEGWKKSNYCPRCNHWITVYQRFAFFLDVPDDTGMHRAACNCGMPHPERPSADPDEGCGQEARVTTRP